MAALIDYTERLVRQEIASWPDGTASFTDYLGSDGVEACDVPITARITIAGDEVIADLTDSAPMVRGLAQQHALVRDGVRLPGDPLRAHASRCRTRRARSGRSPC